MTELKYCEPCRRFFRGDIAVTQQYDSSVTFLHHHYFESFDNAMRLPCALCSRMWLDSKDLPTASGWKEMLLEYMYMKDQSLVLRPAGQPRALRLFLEPWKDSYHITKLQSVHTQSDSAVDFLIDKYNECRSTHKQCSVVERLNLAAYPSRLLDIGTDEGDLIKLLDTSVLSKEEYVCLSHCWGDTKPLALTSKNRTRLASGIRVTDLPKLFQDTVFMTRRLHIRYLWVDSLCIIQDDVADWQIESSRMGSVYSCAACTIAATDSKNSDGGLFFDRDPILLNPQRLDIEFDLDAPWLTNKFPGFRLAGTYLCDVQHMARNCVDNGPLNQRAWVAQERQLSGRIMHFTRTQLFWECHECITCETYPKSLPPVTRPHWSHNPTSLKTHVHKLMQMPKFDQNTSSNSQNQGLGLDDDLYFAWCTFRIAYSKCHLTIEGDKLVALHGIAQQISQHTGDELIAGLWKSRIAEELCWFIFERRRKVPAEPTQWRAPTWSWACSNNTIWVSYFTKNHRRHLSRQFGAEVIDVDIQSKVSGELEHASLRLKCRPLAADFTARTVSQSASYSLDGSLNFVNHGVDDFDTRTSERHENITRMDRQTHSTESPQRIFLVVIQYWFHTERVDDWSLKDCVEGLLLHMRDTDGEQFERIGQFFSRGNDSHSTKQIFAAHRMEAERIITLV